MRFATVTGWPEGHFVPIEHLRTGESARIWKWHFRGPEGSRVAPGDLLIIQFNATENLYTARKLGKRAADGFRKELGIPA